MKKMFIGGVLGIILSGAIGGLDVNAVVDLDMICKNNLCTKGDTEDSFAFGKRYTSFNLTCDVNDRILKSNLDLDCITTLWCEGKEVYLKKDHYVYENSKYRLEGEEKELFNLRNSDINLYSSYETALSIFRYAIKIGILGKSERLQDTFVKLISEADSGNNAGKVNTLILMWYLSDVLSEKLESEGEGNSNVDFDVKHGEDWFDSKFESIDIHQKAERKDDFIIYSYGDYFRFLEILLDQVDSVKKAKIEYEKEQKIEKEKEDQTLKIAKEEFANLLKDDCLEDRKYGSEYINSEEFRMDILSWNEESSDKKWWDDLYTVSDEGVVNAKNDSIGATIKKKVEELYKKIIKEQSEYFEVSADLIEKSEKQYKTIESGSKLSKFFEEHVEGFLGKFKETILRIYCIDIDDEKFKKVLQESSLNICDVYKGLTSEEEGFIDIFARRKEFKNAFSLDVNWGYNYVYIDKIARVDISIPVIFNYFKDENFMYGFDVNYNYFMGSGNKKSFEEMLNKKYGFNIVEKCRKEAEQYFGELEVKDTNKRLFYALFRQILLHAQGKWINSEKFFANRLANRNWIIENCDGLLRPIDGFEDKLAKQKKEICFKIEEKLDKLLAGTIYKCKEDKKDELFRTIWDAESEGKILTQEEINTRITEGLNGESICIDKFRVETNYFEVDEEKIEGNGEKGSLQDEKDSRVFFEFYKMKLKEITEEKEEEFCKKECIKLKTDEKGYITKEVLKAIIEADQKTDPDYRWTVNSFLEINDPLDAFLGTFVDEEYEDKNIDIFFYRDEIKNVFEFYKPAYEKEKLDLGNPVVLEFFKKNINKVWNVFRCDKNGLSIQNKFEDITSIQLKPIFKNNEGKITRRGFEKILAVCLGDMPFDEIAETIEQYADRNNLVDLFWKKQEFLDGRDKGTIKKIKKKREIMKKVIIEVKLALEKIGVKCKKEEYLDLANCSDEAKEFRECLEELYDQWSKKSGNDQFEKCFFESEYTGKTEWFELNYYLYKKYKKGHNEDEKLEINWNKVKSNSVLLEGLYKKANELIEEAWQSEDITDSYNYLKERSIEFRFKTDKTEGETKLDYNDFCDKLKAIKCEKFEEILDSFRDLESFVEKFSHLDVSKKMFVYKDWKVTYKIIDLDIPVVAEQCAEIMRKGYDNFVATQPGWSMAFSNVLYKYGIRIKETLENSEWKEKLFYDKNIWGGYIKDRDMLRFHIFIRALVRDKIFESIDKFGSRVNYIVRNMSIYSYDFIVSSNFDALKEIFEFAPNNSRKLEIGNVEKMHFKFIDKIMLEYIEKATGEYRNSGKGVQHFSDHLFGNIKTCGKFADFVQKLKDCKDDKDELKKLLEIEDSSDSSEED